MKLNKINLSEDVVSMFLGLVIVILIVGLIYNFFQRQRGNVSVPGVTQMQLSENPLDEKMPLVTEKNEEETVLRKDQYEIKNGDSLWKVAQSYYGDGNKWVEIAKANNISNPGVIHSGLVLNIPALEGEKITTETKSIDPKNSEYTVARGDNLWNIAVAEYGDGYAWTQVYQANKTYINNPDKLEIGMKLKLPRYTVRLW